MRDDEHDESDESDDYRHDERDPDTGKYTESATPAPDFTDAGSVAGWFGAEILRLVSLARRDKALTRLRALSSAVDSWQRLHRLATDTDELSNLRHELDELRELIHAERRTGPARVVTG